MPSSMICPSCGGARIRHSHPKTERDHIVKRLLPVSFYRCHDCGWRGRRMFRSPKRLALYVLSLAGYGAMLILAIGVAVGVIALLLTFLGIPLPWNG
jgi:predicted RNA-binding Zn-ribbon protein involved in translation (DUF1610 family)